jgi:predicted nucleic acid-binding protein
MRVFLDANALFSAANSGSNIERLVQLIIKRTTSVTSDLAVEEARRNILAKRPQWADNFDEIVVHLEQVGSVSFPLSVKLDEKDAPLLCAAIRSKCDYFVTGDKTHFGHLFGQSVEGVKVITLLGIADVLLPED